MGNVSLLQGACIPKFVSYSNCRLPPASGMQVSGGSGSCLHCKTFLRQHTNGTPMTRPMSSLSPMLQAHPHCSAKMFGACVQHMNRTQLALLMPVPAASAPPMLQAPRLVAWPGCLMLVCKGTYCCSAKVLRHQALHQQPASRSALPTVSACLGRGGICKGALTTAPGTGLIWGKLKPGPIHTWHHDFPSDMLTGGRLNRRSTLSGSVISTATSTALAPRAHGWCTS